jgi:Uncharacterized protein conserved in bacteria (DUF2252)
MMGAARTSTRRGLKLAACRAVLAIWLVSGGAPAALVQIRPEPEALQKARPELLDQLRRDAYTYFRFVNRPWIARVCSVFAEDMHDMPIVRLHGDAHVEQFALTKDAWGLDDFDDSARGPALVDIVRFLASIDLAARQRGWSDQREQLFDRFFDGYRRALSRPTYRAPRPPIVDHLRAQVPRSRVAFLAWGEKQMEPMTEAELTAVVAGLHQFSELVRKERPELSPSFFQLVRAGWLHTGVGSAGVHKILLRVEGPSVSPSDDLLLEVKELRDLKELSCIEMPSGPPTLRILFGARQLGRLHHQVLAAGPEPLFPELVIDGRQLRDWWIRSWDPSYHEIRLSELRSVRDLADIVDDASVQLGEGSLHEETGTRATALRRQTLTAIGRLERRIRDETTKLLDELFLGWRELASR